jgi:hypothetical protein
MKDDKGTPFRARKLLYEFWLSYTVNIIILLIVCHTLVAKGYIPLRMISGTIPAMKYYGRNFKNNLPACKFCHNFEGFIFGFFD